MREQQQGYLALAGLGAALGGALVLAWRDGKAQPTQQGAPISSSGDIASFGSSGAVSTGIPYMDTWPVTQDTSDEEET